MHGSQGSANNLTGSRRSQPTLRHESRADFAGSNTQPSVGSQLSWEEGRATFRSSGRQTADAAEAANVDGYEEEPGNDAPATASPGVDEALLKDIGAESRKARQFLNTPVDTFVAIDEVRQLPLNVVATRVQLYFVEPQGRALVMRRDLPTVCIAQDQRIPGALSVTFGPSARLWVQATPKVVAVVVVEASDMVDRNRKLLGHAIIRLHQVKGCFESRLYVGEPKLSRLEQRAVALPLTTVVFRVNEVGGASAAPTVTLQTFDFSGGEATLMEERQGVRSLCYSASGIPRDEFDKLFLSGPASPHGAGIPQLDMSYYTAYNERRGVSVVLHSVVALPTPVDRQLCHLWKIVAEIDGKLYMTNAHDWDADAMKPRYSDAVFVFPDVAYRLNTPLLLRVFRMKFEVSMLMAPSSAVASGAQCLDQGRWLVEEYGWAAVSLFAQPTGHLRFAPSLLAPLLEGAPPAEVHRIFKAYPTIASCITSLIERQEWRLRAPATQGGGRPAVCVSVCDPARLGEVLEDRRFADKAATSEQHHVTLLQAFQPVCASPVTVQQHANEAFRAALFQ